LTVSPHKNSELIFEIGKDIGGDKFLALDFKKNDGFKKTLQAAKTLELYRQDYCGCIYSRK
ncbi:MAG: epoxyqueuosine reductase QueH, partial [Candidatus Omnitrophica bacterium]|nr:epoxyqueuosine reductase QueH [Candidatus Omnitrophota bacterium]